MLFKNMTDSTLYEKHLNDNSSLSSSTIHSYVGSVEKFLKHNPDINNLEDYNKFLIEMTIKKRCTHYYSALKNYINWKIKDANTRDRIIKGLVTPKIRNDVKYKRVHLSRPKLLEVISNLKNYKHQIIAWIQYLTGVRAGDVLRLKKDSIFEEDYKGDDVLKILIIGKGKKIHPVYIFDKNAKNAILDYINTHEGFGEYQFIDVFRTKNMLNLENEKRLVDTNYHWYWEDLKVALQKSKLDRREFATHDFRRCYARMIWEKYKDIEILKNVLGHSNAETTMRYLRLSGLQNIDIYKEVQT